MTDRKKVYLNPNIDPVLIARHCTCFNYSFNAFNLGSIAYLKSFDKKLLVNSSAFVVGGRCNSERYKETRVTNLVDIDITSCYGSSIAQLSYPVGTPFVYAVSVNEKGLTLKDFFFSIQR